MSINILTTNEIDKTVLHTTFINNFIKSYKLNKIKTTYNVYIDVINEKLYNTNRSQYTVLIVNDEYLLKDVYLEKEMYNTYIPKLLNDCVDYYICLTKYSYNLLLKRVDKKKLYLLNGLISYIEKPITKIDEKYIYYQIDPHSFQHNVILAETWVEYFLNRPEKLIINLYYTIETINQYIINLLEIPYIDIEKTYYHKNMIIIFNRDIYKNNYINISNISFINCSYYSLAINLYNSIINNNFIITIKNDISVEILENNALYLKKFSKADIKKAFDIFFKYDDKYIEKCIENNKKNINKNILQTAKILQILK
jgi:hypothetical protein